MEYSVKFLSIVLILMSVLFLGIFITLNNNDYNYHKKVRINDITFNDLPDGRQVISHIYFNHNKSIVFDGIVLLSDNKYKIGDSIDIMYNYYIDEKRFDVREKNVSKIIFLFLFIGLIFMLIGVTLLIR